MSSSTKLRYLVAVMWFNALVGGALAPPVGAARAAGGEWSSVGPLAASVLYEHTATLLPNGKVLVVGGAEATAAQLFDPVTAKWSRTGSLSAPTDTHTATLLQDGRVLVVSGAANFEGVGSAEVYDPAAGTWAPAGSVTVGRGHTATALEDGKVLVAGGMVGGVAKKPGVTFLATSELYDPETGKWSPTAPMATGRSDHSAVRLADGKAMVVGGRGEELGFSLNTAEVYDPPKGTWQVVPRVLKSGRASTTATLRDDGQVLVVGGSILLAGPPRTKEIVGENAVKSISELYDPRAGTWSQAPSLLHARRSHTLTALPGAKLLVAGGVDDSEDPTGRNFLSSAELYDPVQRLWRAATPMPIAPWYQSATALVNKPCGANCGKVLVVARIGEDDSSAFLFTAPKDVAGEERLNDDDTSSSLPASLVIAIAVLTFFLAAFVVRRARR